MSFHQPGTDFVVRGSNAANVGAFDIDYCIILFHFCSPFFPLFRLHFGFGRFIRARTCSLAVKIHYTHSVIAVRLNRVYYPVSLTPAEPEATKNADYPTIQ